MSGPLYRGAVSFAMLANARKFPYLDVAARTSECLTPHTRGD